MSDMRIGAQSAPIQPDQDMEQVVASESPPAEQSAPAPAPAPAAAQEAPVDRAGNAGELGAAVLQADLLGATERTDAAGKAKPPEGYELLDAARAGNYVRLGSKGEEVKALQRALKQAGLDVSETGTFDSATLEAVRKFQAEHGCKVDGIVGPETLGAMDRALNLSSRSAPPVVGPTGEIAKTGNAFIDEIAAGAVESMRQTGVPASVTIAQAILESGWGKSGLSTKYHNYFGIKGTGPAGSANLETTEYVKGQPVKVRADFRAYHNAAESLTDHAKLLATSKYYTKAMSHKDDPEQFARDLTGVYATAPNYGEKLIQIMRQYDLTRFDKAANIAPGGQSAPATPAPAPAPAPSAPPSTGEAGPSIPAAPAASPETPAPAGGTAVSGIPPRPPGAPSGSEFMQRVMNLRGEAREQAILDEIERGNIPDFLRQMRPVTVNITGPDGRAHSVTYNVMPDYLAIGSNEDYVRIPMSPITAQKIADRFGCSLPTSRMVDDIYKSADVRLAASPRDDYRYSDGRMMSSASYLAHDRTIDSQLGGRAPGGLVAGHKKDVVISNALNANPGKLAFYGWFDAQGRPIQGSPGRASLAHEPTYADYSHGVRMVSGTVMVDGRPMSIQDLMRDPVLSRAVSNEGPLANPRVPAAGRR